MASDHQQQQQQQQQQQLNQQQQPSQSTQQQQQPSQSSTAQQQQQSTLLLQQQNTGSLLPQQQHSQKTTTIPPLQSELLSRSTGGGTDGGNGGTNSSNVERPQQQQQQQSQHHIGISPASLGGGGGISGQTTNNPQGSLGSGSIGGGGGGGGGAGTSIGGNISVEDPSQSHLQQQQPAHQQQFCLRWNNFQSNIVNSFETLLNREELVDVTLTAEGRSLRAHRVLLSACSPYFRDLFQHLPSHQHPVIVLRDTRFLELKCLLCFIYHGEVKVSQDNLSCLLNLAENLKVKGLAQEGTKRHNSKDYEYCGRGVLSSDREEDLSDGGECPNMGGPTHHGGGGGIGGAGSRLPRPGLAAAAQSPPPPSSHHYNTNFSNFSALGNLLGAAALNQQQQPEGGRLGHSSSDDRNNTPRDLRGENIHPGGGGRKTPSSTMSLHSQDRHSSGSSHQQHHITQQQPQHHSPPSKRRKRMGSPLLHQSSSSLTSVMSSSNTPATSSQQQSSCHNNNNSSGGAGAAAPSSSSSPPTQHNNSGGGNTGGGSSSHNPTSHQNSSHTPTMDEDNSSSHAVNLSVCPSISPPRLMVPKLELITAEDETSNGEKERMERLEQRERLCNMLDKERISGMIAAGKLGGYIDSDMEGEEEPPPHHDEDSGDLDSHSSGGGGGGGGGLSHPLSHHLPPGLQQPFVPYTPTTHAAAAAAAAAAHHFANTFTPGPSGMPSSVSPASWRSHASDQNPNSPQDAVPFVTVSALETLVDSLSDEQLQQQQNEEEKQHQEEIHEEEQETQERQAPHHKHSKSCSAIGNNHRNPIHRNAMKNTLINDKINEFQSVKSGAEEEDNNNRCSVGIRSSVLIKKSDVSSLEIEDTDRRVSTKKVEVKSCKSDTSERNFTSNLRDMCVLEAFKRSRSLVGTSVDARGETAGAVTISTLVSSSLDSDTSNHPTELLKCELLIDEESKLDDNTDHQLDNNFWIANLEKIEKQEIYVSSNIETEVDPIEPTKNSLNTIVSDGNIRYRSKSATETDKHLKTSNEIMYINSLANVVDSLSCNLNKRRRSIGSESEVASHACERSGKGIYGKSSVFANTSALFAAAAAAASKFSSATTNTNNFININSSINTIAPRNPIQPFDSHQSRKLSMQKPLPSVSTPETSNVVDSVDTDDSNDISIINDPIPKIDTSLLLTESQSSLLILPNSFQCSFFSQKNQCTKAAISLLQPMQENVTSPLMTTTSVPAFGPSPSRQSCSCPLCGRHIAQRRSLKQHLMSNYHGLSAVDADQTVRNERWRYLDSVSSM